MVSPLRSLLAILSLLSLLLCVQATPGASRLSKVKAVSASVKGSEAVAGSPLTVNTTSGLFKGAFNGDKGVYRFLGIPYAESTAFQNRFKPPIPKAYNPKAKAATSFGPSCPQWVTKKGVVSLQLTGQDVEALNQDEDCLSLNVWVGKDVRENALKGKGAAPVLLWIHGGGFLTGSSNLPLYSLENFVAKHPDVIGVSINYRLNIFGFPSSPQLTKSPGGTNLGLLDRDLAIEWVHRNIASFGGDPEGITLDGQSAGGAAVDAWSYSHSGKDGLPSASGTGVRGLIIQSGLAQGLDLLITPSFLLSPSSSDSAWNTVAKAIGCGVKNDDAQLACMRKPSWKTLKQALVSTQPWLGPLADGKTWFGDFKTRGAFGSFAKVPTLLGHDEAEGTVLVANSLDLIPGGIGVAPLFTNTAFRCPASDSEKSRSSNGVKTWRYLYSGNWLDVNCGRLSLGAFHSSEIALVFSNFGVGSQCDATGTSAFGLVRPVAVTKEERDASDFLGDSWATFVRDPEGGLDKAGWPRYKSQFDRTVAHVAKGNSGKVELSQPFPLGGDCFLTQGVLGSVTDLLKQVGGIFGA